MTKENRERAYKHLRDLEQNYVALPGRDHDLEKTDVLRAKAKADADAMLKKHPELDQVLPVKEVEPIKEVKEVKKNDKK